MTLLRVLSHPRLPAAVRIHDVRPRDGLQVEKSTVPTSVKLVSRVVRAPLGADDRR